MAQVTNWDKAEVKCHAIIKRLAELPCPNCQGTGDVALIEQRQCSSCFTWLRLECPRCHGDGVKPDEFDTGTVRCGLCDGRGWVPNYDIPIQDMLAHVTHTHGLRDFITISTLWTALLDVLELAAFSPGEVRLTFLQAVEKTV